MRLTLRTLLSYLDDTLEPAQAKTIGGKVAESDQARELMERIKQVTRRRRLTTPPASGPGGMDANTIAEYLDSDVTPEQLAEVEQICLASDVHLAEVAACHQILTLVLGEPALVPPTAKQRMYTLVKGPESIPFRKPPKPGSKDDQDLSSELEPDQDDSLRLGVPALGKGGMDQRNLFLLIGGGVLAALLLAVAIWQFTKPRDTDLPDKKGEQLTQLEKDKAEKEAKDKADKDAKDRAAEDAKKKAAQDAIDQAALDAKNKEQNPGNKKLPNVFEIKIDPGKSPSEIAYVAANMQEKTVGKYVMPPVRKPKDNIVALADTAAVLFQRSGKDGWMRIAGKDAAVSSGRSLVSLPGSRSVIALEGGVEATLWGNLPKLTLDGSVFESKAIFHVPAAPFDADVTLERGRIILRNKKAGGANALVRVRFIDSMQPNEKDRDPDKDKTKETDKAKHTFFDITLNGPEAAVVIVRVGAIEPDEPFFENRKDPRRLGPMTILWLFAFEESANVSYGNVFYAMSAKENSMLKWLSKEGQLAQPKVPELPPWLNGIPDLKGNKAAQFDREKEVNAHLGLAKDLEGKERPIDVVLAEVKDRAFKNAQKEMAGGKFPSADTFTNWQHAVRCSASMDLIGVLYRDFADKETPIFVRGMCLESLQQWLTWSRDHDYELLDTVQSFHNNKKVTAEKVLKLFHMFSEEEARKPETFEYLIENLNNPLLPMRTLSHWHLLVLAPDEAKRLYDRKVYYDPTMPVAGLRAAVEAWQQEIPRGSLPGAAPPPKKKKGS